MIYGCFSTYIYPVIGNLLLTNPSPIHIHTTIFTVVSNFHLCALTQISRNVREIYITVHRNAMNWKVDLVVLAIQAMNLKVIEHPVEVCTYIEKCFYTFVLLFHKILMSVICQYQSVNSNALTRLVTIVVTVRLDLNCLEMDFHVKVYKC